jgi:ketopantoate reductase
MIHVAEALGYDMGEEERKVFEKVEKYRGIKIYGSMYRDVSLGKPTEVEVCMIRGV